MNNKTKISPQDKILKKRKQLLKTFLEKIQIVALYAYALILQLYTLKNLLGTLPEYYYDLVPFLKNILENPYLKFLGSSEKSFILYLALTEFIIFRPLGRFSVLVKFTTLYIFILELIQNLLYYCVDFFCTNDFETIFISKNMSIKLIQNIYFFFLIIYLYSFFRAIRGRFPKFYGVFQKLIDSIAFWLRVKRVKESKETTSEN